MAVNDGFYRRLGHQHCRRFDITSGQTLSVGDVVQFDESGAVRDGATNVEILGLALDTTSPALIDILGPGHEVSAKIETGTMANAEIGEEADINSDDGLTLTESNNDFLNTGWDGANTDQCYGYFKNLAMGA